MANASTSTAMTPSTPTPVASITKPFVAASAVLAAVSWLDRPVIDALPEMRAGWRSDQSLTVRDLLSHTSGLHRDFDNETMAALGDGDDALARSVAMIVGHRQALRPRTAWQYCNGGYWLAGLTLARLRGSTFERAVADVVTEPAQLRDTGFERPSDAARGHQSGATLDIDYAPARRPGGGLCTTTADLLRFADFVFDRPELLATMTQPITPTWWGSWYGLGWEMRDRAGSVIWHKGSWGGYQSCLLLVPQQRFAVAAVANDMEGGKAVEEIVSAELADATGLPSPWSGMARYPVMARGVGRLALARAARRMG